MSAASWIGSIGFTGFYFHLISPTTIFANLIAVPLSFVILALGVASLLGSVLSSSVAIIFNNANWLCTHGLIVVVRFFDTVPGSYFYFAAPEFDRRAEWEIAVLDVGSGGATLIHTPGADWMIDCAHAYEYDRIVKPFLRTRGVNRLDGLLLTHGDSQHIGGALEVLDDFRPRVVIDSPLKDRSATRRGFHAALEDRELPKRIVQRGDAWTLARGRVRATVLYPPTGLVRGAADDKAIVVRLDDGITRALLVSDSGFSTEEWLLANEPDLRADILIKGEHAKDLSGTPNFLRAVQPKLIIATGPDRYRPSTQRDAWIREVRAGDIPLFLQEETGEVRLKMRADGFTATGYMGGQTFRSRAR